MEFVDLDLGPMPKANVKVGADVHVMSVPSVKLAMKFNDLLGKAKTDSDKSKLFIDFISELGMPKKVAEGLSISQMTKLSQGLMGGAEKK